MNNKFVKYSILLFTVIFAVRIFTIFISDRLLSISTFSETGRISIERGITFLEIAARLDSNNAKLYFKKYELLELLIQKALRQQFMSV